MWEIYGTFLSLYRQEVNIDFLLRFFHQQRVNCELLALHPYCEIIHHQGYFLDLKSLQSDHEGLVFYIVAFRKNCSLLKSSFSEMRYSVSSRM